MSEAARPEHDHSMFDAELSGAMLNMQLLGRIMGWFKPYKRLLGISGILVLINSTLAASGTKFILPSRGETTRSSG